MNDTQKHVIAGCLIDPDAFDDMNLGEHHFTGTMRDIWACMLDLRAQDIPIDPITVGRSTGYSSSEMIDWCDLIPSTANLSYYAKIVRDESDSRFLAALASDVITSVNEKEKPEVIRAKLEKVLYDMAAEESGSAVFARDRVSKVVKQMEDAYNNGGKITGISTGFKELDDATNGFQNSDLIIVGARPSVGKTALGVNFAEHMSIRNDLPGLIVSREMSTDAIIRRMICTGARVDLMQGMRGTFKEAQFFDIAASAGKIGSSRLMIDDRELSIQQIRAEARRQKRRNGIKYLMVDYIQLINSPGHDGRTSEVEHVCNQLKACAKELDIPVIALAQVNRESDKDKNNTRPQMHQLKGSGALEQDADLIILLHRAKEAVDEDAEAIIAKQRNGPLKIIPLRFQGSITRFTEKY
jgi:replicative DNA helicase